MDLYNEWSEVKKKLSQRNGPKFVVRQIWWAAVGFNLGEETNCKNNFFERPILILKKISKYSFLGVPITSKEKAGSYYYEYSDGNKKVFLMLHQARIFSNKRLLRKVGKMIEENFCDVQNKFSNYLDLKIEEPTKVGSSRIPNGKDNTILSNSLNLSNNVLSWNLYTITSTTSNLNGVMLRGRLRKLGLENNFNILLENTDDIENGVRFGLLNESDFSRIEKYLHANLKDIKIIKEQNKIKNPILSKLKCNDESRYTL